MHGDCRLANPLFKQLFSRIFRGSPFRRPCLVVKATATPLKTV